MSVKSWEKVGDVIDGQLPRRPIGSLSNLPRLQNSSAVIFPMPALHPVMTATLSSNLASLSHTPPKKPGNWNNYKQKRLMMPRWTCHIWSQSRIQFTALAPAVANGSQKPGHSQPKYSGDLNRMPTYFRNCHTRIFVALWLAHQSFRPFMVLFGSQDSMILSVQGYYAAC